jgi:hypothetical protein
MGLPRAAPGPAAGGAALRAWLAPCRHARREHICHDWCAALGAVAAWQAPAPERAGPLMLCIRLWPVLTGRGQTEGAPKKTAAAYKPLHTMQAVGWRLSWL